MTTPKEFDYDLWRTPEGRYYVRIKATNEECEVDAETFRILHNDAMAMYREQQGIPVYTVRDGKSVLAGRVPLLHLGYDTGDGEMGEAWAIGATQIEDEYEIAQLEWILRKSLTDKQRDVYIHCLLGDMTFREYANWKGIDFSSVRDLITGIRKKAKIIFE